MVPVAMFGFVPLALVLFWLLPPWRAALVALLLAWMFLPIATYRIDGVPDYTKISATCGVVFIAIALFDFRNLLSLRPAWIDVPMLAFCLCPFISSILNGLGVHDGLSVVFAQIVVWGMPYIIGRLYFSDALQLRVLAIGLFAGGVLYAPLCFFELWQGPILHKLVYGYAQPDVDTETRFGILRPLIFMDSGLMLAVWMAAASVLGLWLWRSRALPRWGRLELAWLTPLPVVATILMRSVNGWLLLALGALLLALSSTTRSKWWLVGVVTLIAGYLAFRATGLWSGEQAVSIVTFLVPSKEQSVVWRLYNEDTVVANIHGHALFGYGRQAAALSDHRGSYVTPDSMWIITLMLFGGLGLLSWAACLLVPVVAFVRRVPAQFWFEAGTGPAAGLAVVLVLVTVDYLANAMVNPVFILIAGGLASLTSASRLGPRSDIT